MFSSDSRGSDAFQYVGEDLEAMIQAGNYYSWLYQAMKPYLGQSIVEVGAGVGAFSNFLLKAEPATLDLVEPSKKTFQVLSSGIRSNDKTKVKYYNDYFKNVQAKLGKQIDTIVYVNVFEHIEDDMAEIKRVASTLKPGGHAIIFVPALQSLYSNFDKSIGHYRRYDMAKLKQLTKASGLDIKKLKFMDMVGMLPWWFSFVVMKREKLIPALVKTYDSTCIPIIRNIEKVVPAIKGKNLFLVAQKPLDNKS